MKIRHRENALSKDKLSRGKKRIDQRDTSHKEVSIEAFIKFVKSVGYDEFVGMIKIYSMNAEHIHECF